MPVDFDALAETLRRYHPSPDLDLLKRAFEFSFGKLSGRARASGEGYFEHALETALLVARLRLDVASVCAALLHDLIDDADVKVEELQQRFNVEIAELVESIAKLTRIEFESKQEKQAESFRRMLVAMARDVRVILVKICERLHNMRVVYNLGDEQCRRFAEETQEIYAPLANRLGIHWLKSELEDLSLKYLRPEIYELIKTNLDKTRLERDEYIKQTCTEIAKRLEAAGISASVKGRSKHFASIWAKMERENLTFDEVYDLNGFRVIVSSLRACYECLGVIHAAWKPVPGRFKDYIAMPKPNMYQSLHSTVIGPAGQRIEIQIRTHDMNRTAEEGIAAHWRYKEGGQPEGFDLQWVRDLVETQQYLKNPDEFIQSVKGELFPEEVFVFTPKGDLVRLSFGATPVDFAYSVHTDVGHHTTGARVNGLMVPLDHKLQNGDTVEVITSKTHVPSKDWLRFAVSSKAKQRIRAFLKSEERKRSLAVGIELLTKDLRKVKLNLKKLEAEGKLLKVAEELGLKTETELYVEVGYGKFGTAKVLAKLLPESEDIEASLRAEEETSALERIFRRAAKASKGSMGVKVGGFDDIIVRFAKCCQPLPGDRIVGFITRGRGVSVHHADCPQAQDSDPSRSVEVCWDTGTSAPRRVKLRVFSQDQPGLLTNVTRAITDCGANINNAQIRTTEFGKSDNTFEVTISDARQLERLRRAIEKVAGVIKVERVNSRYGGEGGEA